MNADAVNIEIEDGKENATIIKRAPGKIKTHKNDKYSYLWRWWGNASFCTIVFEMDVSPMCFSN